MKIILLSIMNCVLLAIGQVLWKIGISQLSIKSFWEIIPAIFSPFIILGLLVYGLSTVLWLFILNQADISYVYPMQSLVFIFVLLSGAFILHESIPYTRWIGVFVICCGVYIVSLR